MKSISANLNVMIKTCVKAAKTLIIDFGEIEKLFNISQNHALIEKVKNSRNSSSEQSKDNFSRNPSNKVLVKDNPDQFSKLQSILQNWDSEEAL